MKVALLGLGKMGSGVAKCLLGAGTDLVVWNRSADKVEPFVAAGARTARSARAAVTGVDVVITSLMDDASVLALLEAPDGILAGLPHGSIHLCITTISPKFADQLDALHRRHGSHFVAGPVAGRPDSAAAGQLITFLAGDASAVERVAPLCAAYARRVVRLGATPGTACCMKLCVNYTAVSIIELMGEIYTFAEKCGIPPAALGDFFDDAFAHPALKTYAVKLRERKFAAAGGFTMKGGIKDVRMMLEASRAFGVAFDIGTVVERKMSQAMQLGMENDDWSAFSEITRRDAGLV